MPSHRQRIKSTPVEKIDLTKRLPSELIGSKEWVLEKQALNFSNYNSKRHKKHKIEKRDHIAEGINKDLIKNIVRYTKRNGWRQIEGGENDKMWINLKNYKEKLFNSGRIQKQSTGEYYYFPISSTEEDPIGLAMHYELMGLNYSILPNKWFLKYDKKRERKKRKRRLQRVEREYYDNE